MSNKSYAKRGNIRPKGTEMYAVFKEINRKGEIIHQQMMAELWFMATNLLLLGNILCEYPNMPNKVSKPNIFFLKKLIKEMDHKRGDYSLMDSPRVMVFAPNTPSTIG